MSSPLPPDPYIALGVSKDADVGQIRTAHRKLVLKFHPDRIKGDDTEEKEKAKNEFQKVQQAYELLVDPSKRSKYDDQVRLAELVRERLMHQRSRPPAQPSQSGTAPTIIRREFRRDGHAYEERAPSASYFDERDNARDHERDYFDDPLPRASARKHEAPYERERKPSMPKPTERKERPSPRAASPEGVSSRIASTLRAKAAQVKERSREGHARSQEMRDREKRRERTDKQSSRRTPHAEVESETDSGTETPRYSGRPARPARPGPEPVRVRERRSPVRRGGYDDEDSYSEHDEKWEQHHKTSMDYIAEARKRPSLQRNDSDAYVYWAGDYTGGRRSGSDSERRPASSRRTRPDDSKARPSMPVHSSAPTNLRPYVEERAPTEPQKAPQRSKTGPVPTERERDPRIGFSRSQTMPVNRSSKKDNAPTKGSGLKHSETQDSGYYSNSNPHTPEMKGESPPPSRENSRKKPTSTKYTIVTDSEDDRHSVRPNRFFNSDNEEKSRRYRSPEPEKRTRDRERERERERDRPKEKERDRERRRDYDQDRERDRADRDRADRDRQRPVRTDSDSQSRPSRRAPPISVPRGDYDRLAPSSARESPTAAHRKGLFGEIPTRSASYDDSKEAAAYSSWKYDPATAKTANYRTPTHSAHANPRFQTEPEADYGPGSRFNENLRQPSGGRRPSVAH